MRISKKIVAIISVLTLAVGTIGCGSKGAEAASESEARKVKVALAPGFYPITYADDDGNAAGYDVEVFKAIDELLPEYEFEFEIVDKETMNVGVETGTYQVGINSMFKTPEREEIYLIPENNMGYTAVAGLYREGEEHISSFKDIHDQNLKLHPTNASGTIPNVVKEWNEANPDDQVEIEIVSAVDNNEGVNAIRAGEYDVFIHLLPVINLWEGDLKEGLQITDALAVVPTYPIINKNETELNNAVNEKLAELKESGKLSEISNATFGYDVFELANK